MIAKFARDLAARHGELRNRDTGVNPASHARTSERAEDHRADSAELPETHVHPAVRRWSPGSKPPGDHQRYAARRDEVAAVVVPDDRIGGGAIPAAAAFAGIPVVGVRSGQGEQEAGWYRRYDQSRVPHDPPLCSPGMVRRARHISCNFKHHSASVQPRSRFPPQTAATLRPEAAGRLRKPPPRPGAAARDICRNGSRLGDGNVHEGDGALGVAGVRFGMPAGHAGAS